MGDRFQMGRDALAGVQDRDYPYLVHEDAMFCRAFRLSEDDFLKLCGGLKRYTEHRLNRDKARTQGFDVPRLVDNTEDAMAAIQVKELGEVDLASYLLSEQRGKVQGCVDTIKMNKQFKKLAEREEKEKAESKERMLRGFRRQAAGAFGWSEDSQSAKDWAEEQYKEWCRMHPSTSVHGA
jgi:hypothetical protein